MTNKISVELGIGSVCRLKNGTGKVTQRELFGAGAVEAIKNFNSDIVLSRDSQGVNTNVPRRIVRHSPDGFEWGYGGSGPSDLALNILSIFVGQKAAEKDGLYQYFKWEFIATMPKQGGVIRREDILSWIKERSKNK
ncbi:hypothetical protein NO1_1833 [Candidatus Termititenax aidoneus]|uniref:Uncharacterized protein n=1 Tax=Termititenax aidoneus TaxID=2218524 RepID=A0A388TCU7_TERA1|nr:hypothetical protein NO1_1833 [Candidatus Termititenax aidoneus]